MDDKARTVPLWYSAGAASRIGDIVDLDTVKSLHSRVSHGWLMMEHVEKFRSILSCSAPCYPSL